MQVTYRGNPDLDRFAADAEASRKGRSIPFRLQPTLLVDKDHRSWPGVSWTVDCRDAREVIRVRRALEAFFTVLGMHGAEAIERILTATPAK